MQTSITWEGSPELKVLSVGLSETSSCQNCACAPPQFTFGAELQVADGAVVSAHKLSSSSEPQLMRMGSYGGPQSIILQCDLGQPRLALAWGIDVESHQMRPSPLYLNSFKPTRCGHLPLAVAWTVLAKALLSPGQSSPSAMPSLFWGLTGAAE